MAEIKSKKFTKKGKDSTQEFLTQPKSYISLIYGVLTLIILFLIIVFALKFISFNKPGQLGDDAVTTSSLTSKTYTVLEGDSLWTISEKLYKDGYKWTEIAKANKILNPDSIEKGQKLVIPAISQEKKVEVVSEKNDSKKISGSTYVVAEGDSLWSIAVRAYGDGYKWVEIAKANKLVNPDLIHPGNKFVLPR